MCVRGFILVIPKAALLAGGVNLFSLEEEAFLFNLNGHRRLLWTDLQEAIYLLKSSEFRFTIDDVNFLVFDLELGLLARDRNVGDRDIIRNSPSNRVGIFMSEVNYVNSFRRALDV